MKFSFLLFLLFFVAKLPAQSIILLEEDSVSQVLENVDLSDNFTQFQLDLFYKNNTNENISVNWRREFGENCPLEWDVFTSDQIISYIPQVNESMQPIPMTPVDSHFIVREIFYPRMVNGCCDIIMIFSLDGTPETPIDTGYYHIEINDTGCMATSIQELDLGQFKIYPNPVSDIFNMENSHLIESFEILDLTGKIYPPTIDVSLFPPGFYFCKIKTTSNQTIIQKFVKQ